MVCGVTGINGTTGSGIVAAFGLDVLVRSNVGRSVLNDLVGRKVLRVGGDAVVTGSTGAVLV